MIPFPMQIVQVPGEVMMIFEYDHFLRFVDLERRAASPKDLNPTWMGNSIGNWEGDTLVVDTLGFNDKTWIDKVGHPHPGRFTLSSASGAPTTIRWRTISPSIPKAYLKPWTGRQPFELRPAGTCSAYICEDNMADPPR